MIIKKAEEIQDGDILAKDIILDGEILVPKNTALKCSYISNFKELNLDLIYVLDAEDSLDCEEKEVHEEYISRLSKVMNSLIHNNMSQLQELKSISEDIVSKELNHFQENKKIRLVNREPDLFEHSLSVCRMSVIAAIQVGLKRESISELAYGALLHDVGYRYVTTEYKNVDIDTLKPGEIFDIKKHTIYAFSSLESEEWLSPLQKRIILSHHERSDGSGYPLKQKKLDQEIWIVAVCDAMDSLISGMSCLIVSPEEALKVMRSCRSKFDLNIFDAVMSCFEI